MISYPTYLFVKLSILLLYYRLFSVIKEIRYLIWAGILLQVIGYTAFTGYAIGLEIICSDPAIAETDAYCVNSYKVTYTQSLFSVITDFYVLLLPIGVVAKLQLSLRRRIGLIMVFMTGLLYALRLTAFCKSKDTNNEASACAASVIRAVVSIQKLHTTDTFREAGYISIFRSVPLYPPLALGEEASGCTNTETAPIPNTGTLKLIIIPSVLLKSILASSLPPSFPSLFSSLKQVLPPSVNQPGALFGAACLSVVRLRSPAASLVARTPKPRTTMPREATLS